MGCPNCMLGLIYCDDFSWDVCKMKKMRLTDKLLIIFISIIVIISTFFIINWNGDKDKENTMMYLFRNTNWKKKKKMEPQYTAFMYDVINYFSYQQDKYYKKSMTRDMRIKYTRKNYVLATAFSWGLFDVPIIHQLETSFNPYEIHGLNEQGLGGVMYGTAVGSYNYCRAYMPRRLWRLVKFDLMKASDLIDPINGLKASYMILWHCYRIYNGAENLAISSYHWGIWIDRFCLNGLDFPVLFKFKLKNGWIEKNPKAYYFAWRKIKLAYENGDFETGKYINEKWQKYKDSMTTDEYNYRVASKRIKLLEKQLKENEALYKLLKLKDDQHKKSIKKTKKILKRIGREASKKGWTKTTILKFKKWIKKVLKELK